MAEFADILGLVGVGCFLIAYFLLQKERVRYDSGSYLLLNLAGSILVIISLLAHWNLPAFLLEAAWAIISIYGIYKHVWLKARKQK